MKISELDNLSTTPDENQIPRTPFTTDTSLADRYGLAFKIENQEQANAHLLMCVGFALRFKEMIERDEKRNITGRRRFTWAEAFAEEREAIAWHALAKDVGSGELYSMSGGERIERTTARDFARQWYQAELPASVTGKLDDDILNRVHIRRAKEAKARGEVYWRKTQQLPETQGGLFD